MKTRRSPSAVDLRQLLTGPVPQYKQGFCSCSVLVVPAFAGLLCSFISLFLISSALCPRPRGLRHIQTRKTSVVPSLDPHPADQQIYSLLRRRFAVSSESLSKIKIKVLASPVKNHGASWFRAEMPIKFDRTAQGSHQEQLCRRSARCGVNRRGGRQQKARP